MATSNIASVESSLSSSSTPLPIDVPVISSSSAISTVSVASSSMSSSSLPATSPSSSSSSSSSVPLFTTISYETAVFAHAVNDHERLTIALGDRTINFFEADIIAVPSSSSISSSVSSSSVSSTSSSLLSSSSSSSSSTGAGAMPVPPSPSSSSPSSSSSYTAVMGHNPGDPYDLTLDAWLQYILRNGRGIKLDIKDYTAIENVLEIVGKYEGKQKEQMKEQQQQKQPHKETSDGTLPDPDASPTNNDEDMSNNIIRNENGPGTVTSNWPLFRIQKTIHTSSSSSTIISASFDIPAIIINADVLTGTTLPLNAAPGCRFNPFQTVVSNEEQIVYAQEFLRKITDTLPLAILSPGWTTAGEYRSYTYAMIDAMVQVVHEFAEAGIPITFPVRATYVQSSYPLLKRYLLDPYSSTSLTVWSNVLLSETEEEWLRTHLDPQRTLYDLVPRSPYQPGAKAAFTIQRTLTTRTSWKVRWYNRFRNTVADVWSKLIDNGILSSQDNSLNTYGIIMSTPILTGILVSSVIGFGLVGYNRYVTTIGGKRMVK